MQTLQIEKQISKTKITQKTYDMVLGVTLTVCSFLCLLSTFDLPCSGIFIIILSTLMPILLFLLYSKVGKLLNVFLTTLIAVYFAVAHQPVWSGYLAIANSVITKINEFNHYGLLTYDTGAVSNVSLAAAMALIPTLLLFAYFIVISIKHKLFVPVIFLTLPFILTGIYFHDYAVLPAAAVMAVIWGLLFSGSLAEKPVSSEITAWVFLIMALFGVFVYFIIPYDKYVPSQKIDSIRQSMVNGIDNLRYSSGIKRVQMDSLPDGDLKNAKSLSYTDEIIMQVKMQNPSAVYLKGYVGSVYSNNRWNSLSAAAYGGDYTGLFEWLAKDNFYPQSQISSLCGVSPQLNRYSITVQNIALKSKYIYAPYEAAPIWDLSPQNVDFGKDSEIISGGLLGTRSYSFMMVPPLSADYGVADLKKWVTDNIGSNSDYTQFLKEEMAYRAFVYSNYLDVPDETEKTLEDYFTKETIDSLKNKDYQTIIGFLRRYYLQKFNFTTDIDNLPPDSDFIANFLETGSGYDVHFATLSVMLLRSAGIPARYVEGYYLPHSYVDIYSDTENATLDVKDSFAHAWAEIYVDGVGWIPTELTPGYYTADKDSSIKTGSDEDISSRDKNYYNDQENALSNDSEDDEPNKANTRLNLLYIEIASIILLIIIYIIAAVFMLKAKRKKGFAQPDKTKAALKIFVYAAKLIKFDGIKIDRHSALESSDEISRKYDPLTGMSFRKFLNLVYKARFSSVELETEELDYLQSYVNSLAKQIYGKQGFGKKLILKVSGLI